MCPLNQPTIPNNLWPIWDDYDTKRSRLKSSESSKNGLKNWDRSQKLIRITYRSWNMGQSFWRAQPRKPKIWQFCIPLVIQQYIWGFEVPKDNLSVTKLLENMEVVKIWLTSNINLVVGAPYMIYNKRRKWTKSKRNNSYL